MTTDPNRPMLVALLGAITLLCGCVSGAAVGSPCNLGSDCSSTICSGDAVDAGTCLCSFYGNNYQCGRDSDCCSGCGSGAVCCNGTCTQDCSENSAGCNFPP